MESQILTRTSAKDASRRCCPGRGDHTAVCLPRIFSSISALKAISLVMGALAMAIGGTIFAFSTFANAMKATFNLTQPNVELLGSLGNLGVCTALPAGVFQEKLGPAATLLTGAAISVAFLLLLWSSVPMATFYHNMFFLLAIYFLLLGFGSNFPYIAALESNMKSFPARHRGKVVAVLDSAFSTGPLVMTAVYGAFFINGHVTDEQNQDLRGFFLLYSIVFAAVSVAGVFTIGVYPCEDVSGELGAPREDTDHDPLTSDGRINVSDTEDTCAISTASEEEAEKVYMIGPEHHPTSGASQETSITGLALLRDPTFHLVAWPLILSSAVQLMFFTNIGIYLKSFRHEAHTTAMTMTNFASCTVCKLCLGTVSDFTVKRFPRAAYILATNALQAACLFLCIFWADRLPCLYATTVLVSFSNGAFWCLTPTITSKYFGTRHIGRNWGLMLFCTGLPGWLLQVVFGELYSAAIQIPGVTYCYGLRCFAWSFVVGFGLSAISVLLTAILLYEVYLGRLPKHYSN